MLYFVIMITPLIIIYYAFMPFSDIRYATPYNNNTPLYDMRHFRCYALILSLRDYFATTLMPPLHFELRHFAMPDALLLRFVDADVIAFCLY